MGITWCTGNAGRKTLNLKTCPAAGQKMPEMEMYVYGGSSRALTGEIGLSEIQNVFAEFSICPETTELQKESSRETIFEATATRFELAGRFQPAPARGRFISRGGGSGKPPRRFWIPWGERCRPGTQNFSFLKIGNFELRAACGSNRVPLAFLSGGFPGWAGAP